MGDKEKSYFDGNVPSFHVVAENIPEAFYKAMDAVWNKGMSIRTQYDREDSQGNYIDPPSKDARVLIEIKNPFAQPRHPLTSCSEIGKYIAEIMGVKDHLVVPYENLIEGIRGGRVPEHWPYTYHQRLFDYPLGNGAVNQIESLLKRVCDENITRRAVATTRVPQIDCFLKDDLPCLGEVQLRMPEDSDGNYVLNMDTRWRSRDLYKAWSDNVVALTFLQQVLAQEIERRTGRTTKVGSYADYSTSLHIYGSYFRDIEADAERGVRYFFEKFPDADSFVKRAKKSEIMGEGLVIPQMEDLLKDKQLDLPLEKALLLEGLIDGLKSGRYVA